MSKGPLLTLYHRRNCHLCEEMRQRLQELRGEFPFEIALRDVDDTQELRRRYAERIPVLEADGRELCHFFLDETKVRDYLCNAGNGV